jgi:hypothetical protein
MHPPPPHTVLPLLIAASQSAHILTSIEDDWPLNLANQFKCKTTNYKVKGGLFLP